MGLCLYPDKIETTLQASWSYHGFLRYRKRLADAIKWEDWSNWAEHVLARKEGNNPFDPRPKKEDTSTIKIMSKFLNHSDCESVMSGRVLLLLKENLSGLIYHDVFHELGADYDLQQTINLIKVLEFCIENKTALKWG